MTAKTMMDKTLPGTYEEWTIPRLCKNELRLLG